MNKFIFSSLLLLVLQCPISSFSQPEGREPLYFPEVSVEAQLEEALAIAKAEGKHILLQIGGNWCVWCYRFQDFIESDSSLTLLVNEGYVPLHINYSRENMNEEWMASWGYPQRFGFPVFVILDSEGERIHTQNSAYLEEGKSYAPKAVGDFLTHWTPVALDPESYD